jgi:hypothetical protein
MVQGQVEEQSVWVPRTPEEKEKVRRQMNRLLQTAHFKNSKRYPALFRFIVEETLEGRGEFLKERLIGVRVFDRPADYDTAADPIVRVTIAEIRKRIAQYYHEETHDAEIRIELSPGHYEPEFRPRKEISHERSGAGTERDIESGGPVVVAPAAEVYRSVAKRAFRRWVALFLFVPVTILLALACRYAWQWTHPSAIEQFWAPIVATHKPVIFCLPAGIPHSGSVIARNAGILSPEPRTAGSASGSDPAVLPHATSTFLDHESGGENVVFSDMLATLEIAKLLARDGEESKPRLTTATTMDDLRGGPSILVGGLDNPWTLRAIASLPYRFAGTENEQYWIRDSKHPEKRNWGVDINTNLSAVTRDYALIARVHDQSTGQLVVVAAGIGMSGTAAAGEFLVDPEQMQELRRRLGPAFSNRDVEVVLSTAVVNGIAGAPQILAVTLL